MPCGVGGLRLAERGSPETKIGNAVGVGVGVGEGVKVGVGVDDGLGDADGVMVGAVVAVALVLGARAIGVLDDASSDICPQAAAAAMATSIAISQGRIEARREGAGDRMPGIITALSISGQIGPGLALKRGTLLKSSSRQTKSLRRDGDLTFN